MLGAFSLEILEILFSNKGESEMERHEEWENSELRVTTSVFCPLYVINTLFSLLFVEMEV